MTKWTSLAVLLALAVLPCRAEITAEFAPMPKVAAVRAFGRTSLTAWSLQVCNGAAEETTLPAGRLLQAAGPRINVIPKSLALVTIAKTQKRSIGYIALKVASSAATIGLGLVATGTIQADSRIGTALVTALTATDTVAGLVKNELDWDQMARFSDLALDGVLTLQAGACVEKVVMTDAMKAPASFTVTIPDSDRK